MNTRQPRNTEPPMRLRASPAIATRHQKSQFDLFTSHATSAGSKTASNNSSNDQTCPANFAIIPALGRFLPVVPFFRVHQQ